MSFREVREILKREAEAIAAINAAARTTNAANDGDAVVTQHTAYTVSRSVGEMFLDLATTQLNQPQAGLMTDFYERLAAEEMQDSLRFRAGYGAAIANFLQRPGGT
jgi:hypothetical protein